MDQPEESELACTSWVARVRARGGSDVLVHIHRGAPIDARDAMKIARKTASFGKVTNLLPVGRCCSVANSEEA